MSHATLSGSGTSYTRTLPDGTVQKFNQADSSTPKNIFMTQMIDPQGNSVSITYDTHFRITAITDSLGQVTTITYLTNSGTGANLYKIATITDPFSRSINLTYDSTSTYLLSITDVLGIKSSYSYDTTVTSDQSSFISQLQTPYGVTSFFKYIPGEGDSSPTNPTLGLKCVFPDNSWVAAESWSGVTKSTYFWDRHATQLYPNEPNSSDSSTYTHCRTTQWQLNNSTDLAEPVAQNTKKPLESSLTYYSYVGQPGVDYFGTTNQPATKTRNLGNPKVVATLSGTMTAGDQISFGVKSHTDTYNVVAGDTPAGVIGKIAAIINNGPGNNYSLGVKAVVDGTSLTMHSDNAIATTYQFYATTSTPPATEITTLASPTVQTADVVFTGPFSTGDYLEMDVYLPTNGSIAFYHTVTSSDTPATIASDITSQINANTTLSAFSCKADNVQLGVATGTIHMTSLNPDIQAYGFPRQGAGTIAATEIRNDSVQLESWLYNTIGQMTQYIDPLGRKIKNNYATNGIDLLQTLEAQASRNYQMGAWTYNAYHQPLTYTDGSGQVTQYSYTNYSHQLASVTDANSNTTSYLYPQTTSATVGGTASNNHIETITVFDPAISGGSKAVTYTELTGDTTTTIAAGLAAAINGNTTLAAAGITATNTANVINLKSTSLNLSTYTKTVTGSITITLGATIYGYLGQIDGPMAGNQDVTNFTWDGYGRLYTVADSEGYTLAFSYDAANRPTQTLYPDGTTEKTAYINMDPVLSTDRLGRSTQTSYDVMEQVNYVVDPLGRKTQYTWCTCGSIVSLTDPANNATSWQHDLQGRTTAKVFMGDNPSAPKTTYNYDALVGRLISMTDELTQETDMSYYQDQTNFQKSFPIAINPTATETLQWDPDYKRLVSADNDWGTLSYSYNPYIAPGGAATTGGGRLSLVHNNVIATSDISYSYDKLGRTNNRSINGSANSDSWTFDAMSRVTGESNALGSFTYAYIDDTTGSSKGAMRLASVRYPNGQVTNYSWYPTVTDERLQQISNLKSSSGPTISQYSHRNDAAGQLTQWQQLSNNSSINYSLGYDEAGQLVRAQAGSGGPSAAYLKQSYYAYDLASNRTGAQQNSVNRVRLGGTVTTGDTLTIIVVDSGLSGGQKAIGYTTVAGDTLAKAAVNLAAAISADISMQALRVNASANGTVVSIKSASPNITTYNQLTSGGATETISLGNTANFVENAVVGGTKTTGDIVTITVIDPALSGGQTPVSYTVASADTLATIATGLKNAINANTNLAALGVTATVAGATITIRSNSVNATTYLQTTNASATETVTLSINQNGPQTIAISGTKTTGDSITVTVYDAALASGLRAVTYTVAAGDSLATIASNLAAALTADTSLQSVGISAGAVGQVITITSDSLNATTLRANTSTSATEILETNVPVNGTQTVVIGGTPTNGNTVTVTVYDAGLSGGSKAITYTVASADTLPSIAAGLASAIAADTSLAALNVSATSSGAVVNILSASANMTTYATSTSGGATELVTLAPASSATLYGYNNLNELTSIAPGGPTEFQGSANKALSSASINSTPANLAWSQSFNGTANLSNGVNNVPVSVKDGAANVKTNNYQTNLNGPATKTLSFDANGNMTNDGVNSYVWDAKSRLQAVNYPGVGNNSLFSYDPMNRLVRISEFANGTITATKQFVNSNAMISEERNNTSAVAKKFYDWGQTNSGASYFYTKDHLGSIRDILDSSGNLQGQYRYDMYGQSTQVLSAQTSDFGYSGVYFHQRSNLNLATYRAYSSTLGRWINRDPIGESGDQNLYSYAFNRPTTVIDPSGLQGNVIGVGASGMQSFITKNFESMTGAPAGSFAAGCISVVDFYLGIGAGVVPESVYKSDCFWGKGSDPSPAVEKAKCTKPCPQGTHKVIWCKQGTWGQGGTNPNPPGGSVPNPGSGWNNGGASNFNYAVYFPETDTFIGANVGGGAGYASNSMRYGDEFGSSMCCASCVKNAK
jgi:RHS repeat-associated protein